MTIPEIPVITNVNIVIGQDSVYNLISAALLALTFTFSTSIISE